MVSEGSAASAVVTAHSVSEVDRPSSTASIGARPVRCGRAVIAALSVLHCLAGMGKNPGAAGVRRRTPSYRRTPVVPAHLTSS